MEKRKRFLGRPAGISLSSPKYLRMPADSTAFKRLAQAVTARLGAVTGENGGVTGQNSACDSRNNTKKPPVTARTIASDSCGTCEHRKTKGLADRAP